MLTPTITKHWFDLKTQHVIGYFGGKEGDTYLQSEDGLSAGTKVKWPSEVKTNKNPLMVLSHPFSVGSQDSSGSFLRYGQGRSIDYSGVHLDGYITIFYANLTQFADEADIAGSPVPFYAIFPKF